MKIHVASKAAQKTGAVADACQALGINAEINGFSAPSGINEQPIGEDETTRGARNRLNYIMSLELAGVETDDDLWVSIENGLRKNALGQWIDFAVVLIRSLRPGTPIITIESMGIVFPTKAVIAAQQRGFDKVTAGKMLADLGMVRDHQDPHAELTNGAFPRRKILALAVQMALAQFALTK